MATIVEPQVVKSELEGPRRTVARRLGDVRRRVRQHLLVEGSFWIVGALLLAAAASLALDWLLRLSLPARLALLAIAVVGIAALAVKRLLVPLFLPLENLDLAEILDRRSPGVGQRISNVLQLPDLLTSDVGTSPSMVRAAVNECAHDLDQVDLTDTLDARRRQRLLRWTAAAITAGVIFCLVWPATAGLWARRWLGGSNVRWPQRTYLSVVGLNDQNRLAVPRGEAALVQISANSKFVEAPGGWSLAGRGESLVVESNDAPQFNSPDRVSITLALATGATRRGNAEQFDEAAFRYELPPLAEPAELSITGGDDWFGPIMIEPIDRPTVSKLEITAARPGATSVERQTVGEGSAQFLYLPQTQLELILTADQPLKSAEVFDKGSPPPAWRRIDERTYAMAWTMQQSLALEFRLIGQVGELSSKPYFLSIGLLKDREPRLTIRSSGVGRRVTPAARIPLSIRATDDFGVTSVGLEMERTDLGEDQPRVSSVKSDLEFEPSLSDVPRTEVELDHKFSLPQYRLLPGNQIKLRTSAVDNCVLGRQAANSRWLPFQIVSADELYYEILMRLREQRARFSVVTESAQGQTRALIALSTTEQAIAAARAQQVINRQVWQVANQIEIALDEMELNDLSTAQARELLQNSVIAPMRALHGDLLTRLRTMIDAMARRPSIVDEPRAESQELCEQAVRAMQDILAQMSQWESFVDVINQLKKVISQQNDVLKETEEMQKKRTESLFDD